MSLNKFDFLVESIRNWKKSGTITQSSPQLCKKMTRHLDPKKHHYVAEYGTGDGVITTYILDKLHPEGKLLAFEINESMYEQLIRIPDKRLIAILDSAENIGLYMERENIPHLDSIISSIPFVVLPTELTMDILTEAKKHLKKGGLFVQFNYSRILKDLYKTVFHNCTSEYVLMNTPPAFIFKCTKK